MRFLRRVQLDVVLGQDFEDGAKPQPPLLLGEAVPGGESAASLGGSTPGPVGGFWGAGGGTYSKSVCSLRSARGWKTRLRLRMPSRQAESAVLAKIRPAGGGGGQTQCFWGPPGGERTPQNLQGALCVGRRGEHPAAPPKSLCVEIAEQRAPWGACVSDFTPRVDVGRGWGGCEFGNKAGPPPAPLARPPPCREHSLIFPVIQATALAPILVPKFLSKGVGVPPCARKTTE